MPGRRFEMDASTREEVVGYFQARATQGLMDGFRWDGAVEPLVEGVVEWGARTHCASPEGERFQSVYVYAPSRNQGRLPRYARASSTPFITAPGCHIEAFFQHLGVRYAVAGRFTESQEYRAIEQHYGDQRARRSGVFLMNHIDEGLAVLRDLGASDRAKRAFCLHPLLQADEDLAQSYPRLAELSADPAVLALALEYRNIANATLSRRPIAGAQDIPLGPLPEVADMLRADKVQNYKDFLQHHAGTHPRGAELDRYFRLWLERLGIGPERFEAWRAALTVPGPPPLA